MNTCNKKIDIGIITNAIRKLINNSQTLLYNVLGAIKRILQLSFP